MLCEFYLIRKTIKLSERGRPNKKKNILYNSVYVKFREMEIYLYWQRDACLPEDWGAVGAEGGMTQTHEKLVGGMDTHGVRVHVNTQQIVHL